MALTKKRASRKLCAQNAWITFDGGFAARPCLVEDISHGGVKITLEKDVDKLPGVIHLAFSRDTRTSRRCQVIWRRGRSAGIKFV